MCTTVRESSISSFTPTYRCVDKFTSSSVMSMNNRIILKRADTGKGRTPILHLNIIRHILCITSFSKFKIFNF